MKAVAFICGASSFHPYECGGEIEGCIHCIGDVSPEHDPDVCPLCHFDDQEEAAHLRARLRDALDELRALKGGAS